MALRGHRRLHQVLQRATAALLAGRGQLRNAPDGISQQAGSRGDEGGKSKMDGGGHQWIRRDMISIYHSHHLALASGAKLVDPAVSSIRFGMVYSPGMQIGETTAP